MTSTAHTPHVADFQANRTKVAALLEAAKHGDAALVAELLAAPRDGAFDRSTINALAQVACEHQRTHVLAIALEHDAVCGAAVFGFIVAHKNAEMLKMVLHNSYVHPSSLDDALVAACAQNAPEIIAILLKAGANVHAHEDDPLFAVCNHLHTEALAVLLAGGAQANANHSRSLWWAATAMRALAAPPSHERCTSFLEMLVQHGADIHGEHGHRCLCFAAQNGMIAFVRFLIAAGIEVGATRSAALAAASIGQQQETFDLLYPLSDPQAAWKYMRARQSNAEGMAMLLQRLNTEHTHAVLHHTLSPHTSGDKMGRKI